MKAKVGIVFIILTELFILPGLCLLLMVINDENYALTIFVIAIVIGIAGIVYFYLFLEQNFGNDRSLRNRHIFLAIVLFVLTIIMLGVAFYSFILVEMAEVFGEE